MTDERLATWNLTKGYPLGEAIKLEQERANVSGQARLIVDHDGNIHRIEPDPNAPFQPMKDRQT